MKRVVLTVTADIGDAVMSVIFGAALAVLVGYWGAGIGWTLAAGFFAAVVVLTALAWERVRLRRYDQQEQPSGEDDR